MLCPPCRHRAQQLNQRRISICPAYLRGYKFPPYTLSLRWQDRAPSTNRYGHSSTGWWAMWLTNSVVSSLITMGTVCANGGQYRGWAVWMSLAIGQKPKLNQIRPQAAFEKEKPIKVWLCKKICWHSISQRKWSVTARNIILIYYLILPPPSDGLILHYELQGGSTPWAAEQLTTLHKRWLPSHMRTAQWRLS